MTEQEIARLDFLVSMFEDGSVEMSNANKAEYYFLLAKHMRYNADKYEALANRLLGEAK